MLSACGPYDGTVEARLSAVARRRPSRRARCWTAVVKKDEELTSSQRSNLRRRRQLALVG